MSLVDPNSVKSISAAELSRALNRGELLLHYQPKVRLSTGEVLGVEALIRWNHPELGQLPPADFIPLAEGVGLIDDLTHWVIESALSQINEWNESGLRMSVAVNLSAHNFEDDRLIRRLQDGLRRWKVEPASLELEITESAVMHAQNSVELLSTLSGLGIKLSLDDFGTGYSSLSYLQRLPVSSLKIDKSFVMNMAIDETDATIVEFVVELGHNLGLEVIAEGVRTEAISKRLQELGCDLGQGFHISPPLAPEEFRAWLTNYEQRPQAAKRLPVRRDPSPVLSKSKPLRVVVVDDHTLLRQSLVRAVGSEPGFEVVGEAERGDDAFEVVEKYRPDVVLLDIGLPGESGLQVAARLRKAVPGLRIVFLTMHDDDHSIRTAIGLGADGYVSKTVSTEELLGGLREVAGGTSYYSPVISRRLRDLLPRPLAPGALGA